MDDSTRRNYIIEEQYPDGKAQSGFTYSLTRLDNPPDTIALEIKMTGGDTLRLFFAKGHFAEFADAIDYVRKQTAS